MISLGYYLRVVAAVWMRPAPSAAASGGAAGAGGTPVLAGGDPVADRAPLELVVVAVSMAALTIAAGVVPQPLFDFVRSAGEALTGLF
jgi:NADH-quinone oxidoreductase subunit N